MIHFIQDGKILIYLFENIKIIYLEKISEKYTNQTNIFNSINIVLKLKK